MQNGSADKFFRLRNDHISATVCHQQRRQLHDSSQTLDLEMPAQATPLYIIPILRQSPPLAQTLWAWSPMALLRSHSSLTRLWHIHRGTPLFRTWKLRHSTTSSQSRMASGPSSSDARKRYRITFDSYSLLDQPRLTTILEILQSFPQTNHSTHTFAR